MQSVEIRGLEQVADVLDALPGAIKSTKAQVLEAVGWELLTAVGQRIGGRGRMAGVQGYRVGSGKGYVAVSAARRTELDGYAAGYVTNALEGGHAVRQAKHPDARSRAGMGRVPGKYMYRDTERFEAERLAEEAARRIETAVGQFLEGVDV